MLRVLPTINFLSCYPHILLLLHPAVHEIVKVCVGVCRRGAFNDLLAATKTMGLVTTLSQAQGHRSETGRKHHTSLLPHPTPLPLSLSHIMQSGRETNTSMHVPSTSNANTQSTTTKAVATPLYSPLASTSACSQILPPSTDCMKGG